MSINCRGAGTRGINKLKWIRGLRRTNNINLLCGQESQLVNPLDIPLGNLWGNTPFESSVVGSSGRSGGLFCIWDPSFFTLLHEVKHPNFILLSGTWAGLDEVRFNFVNVYASINAYDRRNLWDELINLKSVYPGWWVFLGDFNETRVKEDRLPVSGCDSDMAPFNNFILMAGLFEYNMGGRRFTWMSDDGCHLSKIDRFLVCKNFLNKWPSGLVTALPRIYPDHCPLVFSANQARLSPVPFKIFNSWLTCDSLAEVVIASRSIGRPCSSKELNLMRKLKKLKEDIKAWRLGIISDEEEALKKLTETINDIEIRAEVSGISDVDKVVRDDSKIKVLEINLRKNLDLRQKTKVRWDVEGDENSKFFHGFINGNIKRSRINGISSNGCWETDPGVVKDRFFKFFAEKFDDHTLEKPKLRNGFFKK
ncbi:uncharacterized protein LOC143529431 [Bidens hawaiensis]|uniref:uncharacterized protein LOC143529431 n=1 Tax=Bidens hawaiensis TaxID=980011 RepID=UPI004049A8EE